MDNDKMLWWASKGGRVGVVELLKKCGSVLV